MKLFKKQEIQSILFYFHQKQKTYFVAKQVMLKMLLTEQNTFLSWLGIYVEKIPRAMKNQKWPHNQIEKISKIQKRL